MNDLRAFRLGLEPHLEHPYARPFVCAGSPLRCRSFIVGFNAATCLKEPFSSYWSDSTGFDYEKFQGDYKATRRRSGNRPRIECISKHIEPCLETNLYAVPTPRASQLAKEHQRNPVIEYLFRRINPELVFVHSNKPIQFFQEKTGCKCFTTELKRASWHGHEFWLFGRCGPLYRMSRKEAAALGEFLAAKLG